MGISIKNLMKLSSYNGKVGFFSDITHPVNESTEKFGKSLGLKTPSSPIDVAHLAKILNDGFFNKLIQHPVAGRPFMTEALNNIKSNIKSILIEALSSENPTEKLNDILISYIHSSMKDGNFAENYSRTIWAKGSEKPLFDEGFLYNSVESRD